MSPLDHSQTIRACPIQRTLAIGVLGFAMLVGAKAPAYASLQCEYGRIEPSTATSPNAFGSASAAFNGLAVVGRESDSAYVERRVGSNWYEEAVLTGSDTVPADVFGYAVDVGPGLVVVGAPKQSSLGPSAGAVYVFASGASGWSESAKLLASDGGANDLFGWSLAIDGTRLIVGASGASPAGTGSGAAYVFEQVSGVWQEVARLAASDGIPSAAFGISVELDGDRAIVGARHGPGTGVKSGAVYVFDFDGSVWVETAILTHGGRSYDDQLGSSVSIDGDRIVAGAIGVDLVSPLAGAAYIFERNGGGWRESARLVASDGASFDLFGQSVAIEGTEIVVGAPSLILSSSSPGKAYRFSLIGSTWIESTLSTTGLNPANGFGWSCAIDGDDLLVGTYAAVSAGSQRGFVATYSLTGTRCYDLAASVSTLSVSFGGTESLSLTPGAMYAGKLYLLAGSATGSSPGVVFGSNRFPLNYDPYLVFSLSNPNLAPVFGQTLGTLDANGAANATISIPAGTDPALAGIVLTHAYAVLDPFGPVPIPHVSTTATLTLDS